MHQEHFIPVDMRVNVLRGYDGYWAIIHKLDAEQGEFTAADVDGESNSDIGSIRRYLRNLTANGFLQLARVERNRIKSAPLHFYRLVKRQKVAPHFRSDGTLIPPSAQQCIWTAIRTLRQFTLTDLVFAARTPETSIGIVWAKRYLTMLHKAGYLVVVNGAGRNPVTWRLKPAMNTGPKPPMRAKVTNTALWDPNRRTFVGETTVEVAA